MHELLVHNVLSVMQIVFYHHTIVQRLLSTLEIVASKVSCLLLQIAIGHTVVHSRWNHSALFFLRLMRILVKRLAYLARILKLIFLSALCSSCNFTKELMILGDWGENLLERVTGYPFDWDTSSLKV